jgi:acyl-CoA synthetase (AMP-forming)/AMP-acid ligase II
LTFFCRSLFKSKLTEGATGGENIYPVEIESRLVAHPSNSIARAAVVGIPNPRLGEVVGAFLQPSSPILSSAKPTDDELRDWTRKVLGRHKAPAHIFWLGEEGISNEIPQTGSGKIMKHVLREWGGRIVREREEMRKLSEENRARL